MRRAIVGACLTVMVVLFTPVPLAAALDSAQPIEMTTADIAAAHISLDGSEVVFQGEAIGEALRAGRGESWVNVLDGGIAIGVVVTDEQLERIDTFGDYRHFGTELTVFGTLNLVCNEHGGDLDVHADRLVIVEEGSQRNEPFSRGLFAVGSALLLAGVALAYLYSYQKRQSI